ncbi:MAG: hypothetical protein ACRDKL_01685 [Solirubrobacteraceae bacterium]
MCGFLHRFGRLAFFARARRNGFLGHDFLRHGRKNRFYHRDCFLRHLNHFFHRKDFLGSG